MKISDPLFLKTAPPILPTPPFLWEEKSELPLFWKNLEIQPLNSTLAFSS